MKVVFSYAADQDFTRLVEYITDELQNPIAAHTIATKILQRSQALASFPEMGAGLEVSDQRLRGYRYLLVDNYLIVYAVNPTQVTIIRIVYARSDYVQLLHG